MKAFAALEAREEPPPAPAAGTQPAVETQALGRLAQLPPFRPVIITLLRVFDQADVNVGNVARLVESDPAVVSEVLVLVNSPAFAIRGNVANAAHAISLLGLERTRSLVSALAIRAMMANAPRTPVVRRFWTHSVATATIAHHLAPTYGVGQDIAYVAGMMHDLGRMGLLSAHPDEYTAIALASHDTMEAILAAEQGAFGMDHCRAGLLLARAWGLPDMFHSTVEHHHAPSTGQRNMTALIQLACHLADSVLFQAILHRDATKPMEAVEAFAPQEFRAVLIAQLDAMQGRVLDTIQALDY